MAPQLLLIEDDPDIARFVAMALEGLDLEVTAVTRLSQAREALGRQHFDLVLSDLMLPDGTAETLLSEGHAGAAGAPPWVVFSAGLHAERERQLRALGVRQLLHKPVSLGALCDSVSAALAATAAVPHGVDATGLRDDAVQQHFGGDRALFEAFRSGCLGRFATDVAEGQAACERHDTEALRHLGHSLKSVLQLIGAPALAAQARDLEQACEPGAAAVDWAARAACWARLAAGLRAMQAADKR